MIAESTMHVYLRRKKEKKKVKWFNGVRPSITEFCDINEFNTEPPSTMDKTRIILIKFRSKLTLLLAFCFGDIFIQKSLIITQDVKKRKNKSNLLNHTIDTEYSRFC